MVITATTLAFDTERRCFRWVMTLSIDCEDNLQEYIDMTNLGEGYGRVVTEKEFLEFCNYPLRSINHQSL
jgi:hypothetical protein